VANGQTQVSFSLSNYSTPISGYQIQLGNLNNLSNSTFTNGIQNWLSNTQSSNQSISIASISLTPTNAQNPTLLATYTLSQGSITQPLSLSGLSLVIQTSNGPIDVPFEKSNFNFAINGNIGFSIADNTRSGGNNNIGFDTFSFSDVYKNYTLNSIKAANNDITINVIPKTAGTQSTLINAQRIKFSDLGLAYDMNGNTGSVVKILGAIFGAKEVNNSSFVGIGLSYIDQGMSYPDLISLALNAKLGANFTQTDEINLLFQNLLNTKPSTSELNTYLSAIQNKTYTTVTLAQLACDTSINTSNIGLTGLAEKGLMFNLY
jgi:hypothetical protein